MLPIILIPDLLGKKERLQVSLSSTTLLPHSFPEKKKQRYERKENLVFEFA